MTETQEIFKRIGVLEKFQAASEAEVGYMKADLSEIKADVKQIDTTLTRLTIAMEKPRIIGNAAVWIVCVLIAAIVSYAISKGGI